MKVALTGGIACGKSTVARLLVERGAKLVDADQVAREVVLPGQPALAQIAAAFGPHMIAQDGTLNRAALGQLVFNEPDKLRQLENILHPAIRTRMQEQIEVYLQQNAQQMIIADIPLLFETGQANLYDATLVVYCPRNIQLERLMQRNQMSEEEANRRINLQLDIEKKRHLADYIIDNQNSLEHTVAQVDQFWHRWESGLLA